MSVPEFDAELRASGHVSFESSLGLPIRMPSQQEKAESGLDSSREPRPTAMGDRPSFAAADYAAANYAEANYADVDYTREIHWIESGQYGEALTSLNRAVTQHPYDHTAWTLRGMVLVYLGQYDAAIASCDRALMLQPNHAEAWKFRGLALHGLNRYRDAYASYDRALGIERRSPIEAFIHWMRQRLHPTAYSALQDLDMRWS